MKSLTEHSYSEHGGVRLARYIRVIRLQKIVVCYCAALLQARRLVINVSVLCLYIVRHFETLDKV